LGLDISMAPHQFKCVDFDGMSTCFFFIHADTVNWSRVSQWHRINLDILITMV
jgi:hypothetical protein